MHDPTAAYIGLLPQCSHCAAIKSQCANVYLPIHVCAVCITQLIYSASNERIYVVFLLRECVSYTFLIPCEIKMQFNRGETKNKPKHTKITQPDLADGRTDGRTNEENNKYSLFITIRTRGYVFSVHRTFRTSSFYKNYCDCENEINNEKRQQIRAHK